VATRKPAKKKAVAKKAKPAPKKAAPKKKAAPSKKPAARKKSPGAPRSSPPRAPVLQPDITAPPAPRPVRARRVSIGEALAQLNAATLEGVTKELVPFGLNPDAPLTPSVSLASLLGPDARPVSALISALEQWDGEGADLMLVNEASTLLRAEPRDPAALEAFVRRNCLA